MRSLTIAIIASVTAGFGCAQKGITTIQPRIGIDDLVGPVQAAENSYMMLAEGGTVGRFGCSLAIAQLAPSEDDASTLSLVRMRPSEEAYWAEALCGVAEIRDLRFLSPVSVRPEQATVAALCRAAQAGNASLLLLYSPNRYGANSAQVLGVLLDPAGQTPIASLHASDTHLDRTGAEVSVDDRIGDRRGDDAAFQATRVFERHLLDCLAELIARDSSLPATQPHNWQKPREDRWWLPHR